MRPLHALLLVVVLAAVILGALLFVRSDSTSGRVATALPEDTAGKPNSSTSALTAPDKDDPNGVARTVTSGHSEPIHAPGDAPKSSAVHGRVVDATNRGVAGATVYAAASGGFPGMAIDEYEPRDLPFFSRVDATTDGQGRFSIEPKAQGAVRLAVRASGFAPLDVEKPIAGNSPDVGDLVIEAGVVLNGRVIDSSGRGVAGAEIHRQHPEQNGGAFAFSAGSGPVIAKTDDRGDFRVDQLAVGPWSLLVSSELHPDKKESGESDHAGLVAALVQITLEDGFDIQGRVTGAPADALKNLVVSAMPGKGQDVGDLVDAGSFALGQARRGKVAGDGTFTVHGTKKGGTYRLSARLGERRFVGGARSAGVEAKAGDRGVEIVYRPETALVFQVVDAASGAPVTEMSVQAGFRFPFPLLDEKMKPVRNFPDGRVRFESLPQGGDGEMATLILESPGYATFERKDLRVQLGRDNDLGVIKLERSALVRVTVLDLASGAPIAGAQVSLNEVTPEGVRGMTFTLGGEDEEDTFMPQGSAHRGKTDATGQVAISSLVGKRATLSVKHKEHADYKSETLDLPNSGDVEKIVKLAAGGTVIVHVVDRNKKSVSGQGVEHKSPSQEGRAIMIGGGGGDDTTDAEGKVTFAHLPAGQHLFRMRKSGGGGLAFGGGKMVVSRRMVGGGDAEENSDWTSADVAEGATINVELAAPELGTLTGRVTESGKPLAGATVALKAKGGDALDLPFMDDGVKGETNAKGEYTIEKVQAGDYRVVVTHPLRTMPWEGEARVRDGDNRSNFEIPLAIVEGRVTTADGKPIAGARVHAERVAGDSQPQTHMVVSMVMDTGDGASTFFGGAGGGGTVSTDAEGRYRLRGVTPDVELTVIATGKDYQRESVPAFKVAPDQVKAGVDLQLKQGGAVDVIVRRPGSASAGTFLLHARVDGSEDADVKTEVTNPEGKAHFTGLKPGRWRISCSPLGGQGSSDSGAIPDQALDVTVGPAKTLTFDAP